ncbi:PAS domain S-box-containing protein [Paraburkholderia sp. GAS448]|uniref:sensor histidine kinase n=1 Tax=Paraburkholderia sp. GAS448 TaxID=3035136 RepID=UPI003D1D4E5E
MMRPFAPLMLRSLNLHAKLMLALALLVALVAGSCAYFLIEHQREQKFVELEDRAARIADLLSHSLALPLWNVDRAAIGSQLAALAPNPEVVQFTVTAANYGVIAAAKGARRIDPANDVVRVRPIEYQPPGDAPLEKLGEIRVELSRAVATQETSDARRAILATIAAMVATLYVTTLYLLNRMVRKPINRLEEMVDRIAGGNLDARCAVESDDEIGRLAARVNAMASRLRESTMRLGESERMYRSIVENALEGIFRLDRSGRLEEANPAMARLLGFENPEALVAAGAGDAAKRPFSPHQVEVLFRELNRHGEIAALELQLQRLDGVGIWVQMSARGIADQDGHLSCLDGLLADVTSRKHALESLRRHRDELELEVGERKRTEFELRASREQLQQLSWHLEAVREEERKRIALEIHDELGQLLTALKFEISLLRMRISGDEEALGKADSMRELVEKTMWVVRNVVNYLRPAALNFGIVSALEWLAEDFNRRHSIRCQVVTDGDEPALPDSQATAVFRIAQESLTNVARHSGASHVMLTLSASDASFDLQIKDDGCGFHIDAVSAKRRHSYGLLGMAERARLIGAELSIESSPGTGTVVSLHIPLLDVVR